MNHTLAAFLKRVALIWQPRMGEGEEGTDLDLPEQPVVEPSPEAKRQGQSVDVFVTNTARERERLEARLDRQISLMTGARYRSDDGEERG